MLFIVRGLIFSVIVIVFVLLIPVNVFAEESTIPIWVKNTAGLWATDATSANDFVVAIEFLVNNGIVQTSITNISEKSQPIPNWVKNISGWWATDEISENDFVSAIEFLIKSRIIDIKSNNNCQKDLQVISSNIEKIDIACKKYNSNETSELIPFDTQNKINKKGFVGNDFSTNKSDSEFRIFVLGGSVIYGSGNSSPQTTIPYILQKMIENNNASHIKVINAASGSGNSLYQIGLVEEKIIKYDPNLVIIYSGWNDIVADYPTGLTKYNLKSICQIGNKNNFDVMIFIQPIAGFGNKILTEQEKINMLTGEDHNGFQLIQMKSMYEYLSNEIKSLDNYCHIVDLRDAFDDISGPVYWDQGHLSDVGNFIIADKFLEELSKTYVNTFSYDEKFIKIISKYNNLSILQILFSELDIDVDYSDLIYQNETKIKLGHGNYFELKNKFGIEEILVGKDLSKINLENIDLSGQDLTGANLSGQDLRTVDLTNTIIRDTDLSYTNLEGMIFSGIDIRGIDFSYANMKNVYFEDAIMVKPIQIVDCPTSPDVNTNLYLNFKCAIEISKINPISIDFTGADLINAQFGNYTPVWLKLSSLDFTDADLTNSYFTNVVCITCIFKNSILDRVKIENSFFVNADFSNIDMKNFEIINSWMQSATFENTNMMHGIIDKTKFVDSNFNNTDLNETKFINDIPTNNTIFSCKNNTICVD